MAHFKTFEQESADRKAKAQDNLDRFIAGDPTISANDLFVDPPVNNPHPFQGIMDTLQGSDASPRPTTEKTSRADEMAFTRRQKVAAFVVGGLILAGASYMINKNFDNDRIFDTGPVVTESTTTVPTPPTSVVVPRKK